MHSEREPKFLPQKIKEEFRARTRASLNALRVEIERTIDQLRCRVPIPHAQAIFVDTSAAIYRTLLNTWKLYSDVNLSQFTRIRHMRRS